MNRMQFTAAVVKCALRSPSPSGLADVREQLKATTRKAQHTPKNLDSLGMIITRSSFLWRQSSELRCNHPPTDRTRDDDCAEKSPPTAF